MQTISSRRLRLLRWLAAAAVLLLLGLTALIWLFKSIPLEPSREVILPAPTTAPTSLAPTIELGHQTFMGRVVDSRTHQPVNSFYAKVGYIRAASTQPIRYFSTDTVTSPNPFCGGRYKLLTPVLSLPNSALYVRIEARGYQPAVSPPQGGSATVDFELQPAPDLIGHVYTPDGSPAAGVAVAIALPGNYLLPVDNGKLNLPAIATPDNDITDSSGRFELAPQSGPFTLVAVNEAGFAQADQDALAASTDLHLARWGRIEGTLRVGNNPPARTRVGAEWLDTNPGDPNLNSVSWFQSATTDSLGHFVFDRIRPGNIRLGRFVFQMFGRGDQQAAISNYTQRTRITLAPGESKTMDIGGGGRRVTGKLVLPAAIASGKYLIGSNIEATPSGTTYCMEFDKDLDFHIEDVQPGDYHATVQTAQFVSNRPNWLPPTLFNFTMPPVTADLLPTPLAIPDIIIK